jgi:hypothetical protein
VFADLVDCVLALLPGIVSSPPVWSLGVLSVPATLHSRVRNLFAGKVALSGAVQKKTIVDYAPGRLELIRVVGKESLGSCQP